MKLADVWFSAIAEAENSDRMIVVSGRTEIEPFIQSGKFKERVEITWKYEADSKGMPNETTGKLMEEVQTVLKQAMEKDKLAIFTGIYTGDGERTWVFYTRNIPAFGRMLNETLAPFETLPLTIYTENIGKCASFKIRIMTMKTSMNESDTALNVHSHNEKSVLTYRHIHSVFGSNGMFTWRRRTGRYYYYLCQ